MNKEKLKHHIVNLKLKHQELDVQIKEAFDHYDSDQKIKELKVKKLQVKKEIEWLESELAK